MRLIEIKSFDNGGHNNNTVYGNTLIPEGWAVIPDDMVCENFPFGEVEAEEITYYREKEIANDDGETEIIREPYTVMTVTKWTPGVMPEPTPEPAPEPTADELMDILLGVTE